MRTEEKAVSVVITSIKPEIATLQSVASCPVPWQLTVSTRYGLGYARNWGAYFSSGEMLVFLDDDISFPASLWPTILDVEKGEFAMSFLSGFPCTRIMTIHRGDFWRVGGFDSGIEVTGEDRDFYARALAKGLHHKPISLGKVRHFEHSMRHKNIHVAIRSRKENMVFIVKYWRRHPHVFRIDFWDRLRRFQIRTLLLQVIFFPWAIWHVRRHGK